MDDIATLPEGKEAGVKGLTLELKEFQTKPARRRVIDAEKCDLHAVGMVLVMLVSKRRCVRSSRPCLFLVWCVKAEGFVVA